MGLEDKNGMDQSNEVVTVQEDSHVEISFKLTLLDGTLVDQTEADEVFAFQIGDGQLLNRLDELLIGLEVGTTGKFTLMPEQAFGLPDPANFQTLSRSHFPETMTLEEGYVIGFNTPTGEEVPAVIHRMEGDEIVVDFNHPLSGQVVVFEATIQTIFPAKRDSSSGV